MVGVARVYPVFFAPKIPHARTRFLTTFDHQSFASNQLPVQQCLEWFQGTFTLYHPHHSRLVAGPPGEIGVGSR